MRTKLLTLILAGAALTLSSCGNTTDSGDAAMDKFIDSLMSKMTVDEKIGQLNL